MEVKAEPVEIPIRPCQALHDPQHLLKSINELSSLSVAIGTFKRRFDDLEKHIKFVQTAINFKLSGSSTQEIEAPLKAMVAAGGKESIAAAAVRDEKKPETASSPKSEIQRHCETMCSRGLRKYIFNNLSDPAKLREEVPAALRLAKNPAKLVLDSIGRFYLQGSKAYANDSPMIPARTASVLALECFLLMPREGNDGEVEIEKSVKAEAEVGAVAWRKRLMIEGGLARVDEMDARGLLLLISGFGIPQMFKHDDLRDLIKLSKPSEISNALRRSVFLVPRIPGIIEGLVKQGKHVDAVNFAYNFRLEDKFPPQELLTSFLKTRKEGFERTKRKPHLSPMALKDANEKQLSALKSVVKCLESRNADPGKFLPGWQIKEQMKKLEKDVADLGKQIEEISRSKRRMEEIELSNRLTNQEIKRPRFAPNEPPLIAPPRTHPFRDHRFASHAGGPDISALVNSYLNPSSVSYASGIGSFPETGSPHVTVGSYPGVYGEAARYGSMDATYIERPARPSYMGSQTSVRLQSLFGPPVSAEGLAGLPEYSVLANRNSSDLYGFADIAAAGNESRRSGSAKRPIL